jgi:hypothetical protein
MADEIEVCDPAVADHCQPVIVPLHPRENAAASRASSHQRRAVGSVWAQRIGKALQSIPNSNHY